MPPDSVAFEQEVAVAKVLTKYSKNRAKCDQKVVTPLQLAYEPANPTKIQELQDKWTACGALDPTVLARIDACFAKAADSANVAMDKLDQTQKLPACLPLATAQMLVAETIDSAGLFSGLNYCAWPSGAFVDGPDAS